MVDKIDADGISQRPGVFALWEFVFSYYTPINITKNISKSMMKSSQTRKPLCTLCKREMGLVEGDVIFGEKWYHKECAKQLTAEIEGSKHSNNNRTSI